MQPTILVADDDESIRLLLATLLGEAGYDTVVAEDGRVAVDLATEHKPDIAILDVMMPGLNGFDACRAIKADQRTADIPVLLLTALAQIPSKVEGLDCGASDYITKPFVANELLARLRTTLVQKQRRDALAAEALTDALTGVVNRRGLEQQLDQLLAHGERAGEAVSLVMFDADHFKVVNDTYGHEVGDVVLAELARRAREAMRQQDVIGRFGGEEFVAILPGADREAALSAAERLRVHVQAMPVRTKGGPVALTISVGVATAGPEDRPGRAGLLAAADRALYSAKRAGRNRVVHADGQPAAPLGGLDIPEAASALVSALALVHAPVARHSRAVAALCWELCVALGLAAPERDHVVLGGLLHDVGVLAMPRAALEGMAPPCAHQDEALRAQLRHGEQVLESLPTLRPAALLVAAYLEWWDGSGYPHGLRGDEIPLGARIISVAHACDMLHASRQSDAAVVAALRAETGTRLDPRVADAAAQMLCRGA